MKNRRTRRKKESSGAPKWMVTFSDMVTLILVFFILLFSMSQIDAAKFEAIADSFRNRMVFDFFPSAVPLDNPSEATRNEDNDLDELDFPKERPKKDAANDEDDSLDTLMEDIEQYVEKHNLSSVVSANRTSRGVVLVLQESILFDSGQAEIRDTGKPFLKEVGKLLFEIPNHVKVEGHTDSNPMSSYRYPSNWELSGARASSVIRYLIQEYNFDMTRFSVIGYGENRPVEPNDSPQNMRKNRRVEIVILDDDVAGEDEGN